MIVIDMQPEFITRQGFEITPPNVTKADKVIDAQVEAIKKARESNVPIVFIEYKGGYGDTNSRLKDAAKNYGNVKYVEKDSDGMFEEFNSGRQELIDHLKKNNVGTLIITGANGGACVFMSIQGALDGNCSVIAYSKGIADFNFQNFIYPYNTDQYKSFNEKAPNCPDCKFDQTSRIEHIADAMMRGNDVKETSSISHRGARTNK